jgi:hypothetical protein
MNRIRIYRLLPISLLILCGAILPGVNALAQSAGIAVGSASGLPGETVTIPVGFTAGATAVSTVQFDLMFSSSITYGSTATGAAAAAASKSASANAIAGGLRVMVFGLNANAIGSGVLAEVQFTISGSAPAGIVPISIAGIVASDPSALMVSTIGSDGTVQVLAPPDTTPPTISGVMSSNVTSVGASILWATNEAADSQVEYGTTTAYGSSTTLNTGMTLSHMQSLTGLAASTTYNYRVKSRDAAGNLATSGNYTFTTSAAPDSTPPVISGVTSSSITSSGATISWNTNEAADTQIEYGTTTAYGSSTTLNTSMATAHSQALSGLTASTTYNYRVKSRDAAGNLATSGNYAFLTSTAADTTPPVISAITVSGVTDKSATISWVTDKPSDSGAEHWLVNQPLNKSGLADSVIQHSLTLNDLKRQSQYSFRLKSTDSQGNQAVSPELTFTTAGSGTSLLALPHFSTNAGRQNPDGDIMVGMALANIGTTTATLNFTAIDQAGNLIAGPGIINPATRDLTPGAQFGMLDLNVFGEGLAASNSSGWIKVESTSSDVGGFFMTFDDTISLMDGASFGYAVKNFVFTEIEPAGSTRIEIANPSSNAASIAFSLMQADGIVRGQQTRTIYANGAFNADLFVDLFAGITPNPTDYVLMQSDENVQPFQLMQKRVGDISSLPGHDATAGATILYSPQYVMGDPWRSRLSVVNLDSKPGIITLQLFGDDGVPVGSIRTMPVTANGKVRIEDPEFFTPLRAGTITSGYVKISSDGIRLAGSTVFGDGSDQSFSSALPLIHNLKSSVLYSHVASNDKYFTGIAILNPGLMDANVSIDVFAADGSLIDRTVERVSPMQKKARLLTQYIPLLTGRNLTSGYIRLTSDWPVASFSLFGTNDLSVLSAIPAQ